MAKFKYSIVKNKGKKPECTLISISGYYECEHLAVPTALKNITVTTVSNLFFKDIKNLKVVDIPDTLKRLGRKGEDGPIFPYTVSAVNVSSGNVSFKSVDGVLYDRSGRILLFYPPCKKDKTFTVPSSVQYIATNAFYGVRYLEELTFTGVIKTLKPDSFVKCISLCKIKAACNDIVFSENAFNDCDRLECLDCTGIRYYESDDGVLYYASPSAPRFLVFYPPSKKDYSYRIHPATKAFSSFCFGKNVKVKELQIPNECVVRKSFDRRRFIIKWYQGERTKKLESKSDKFEITPKYPVEFECNVGTVVISEFNSCVLLKASCHLLKPNGCLSIPSCTQGRYKVNITEIHRNAFSTIQSSYIKELEFPHLKKFDLELVRHLSGLSRITGDKVGEYYIIRDVLVNYDGTELIFCPRCIGKDYFVIRNRIISIASNAFYKNANIGLFFFDGDHINISSEAFSHCRRNPLTIVFSQSVNSIGPEAFTGCSGALNIVFNGNVDRLDIDAFSNCTSKITLYFRKSIKLPDLSRFRDLEVKLLNDVQMDKKVDAFRHSCALQTVGGSIVTENTRPKYLPAKSIVIVSHKFSCIVIGHSLSECEISVRMVDAEMKIHSVKVKVGYCHTCKKYYMYQPLFEQMIGTYVRTRGWKILEGCFHLPDGTKMGFGSEGLGCMAKESILKVCGYTVDQRINMNSSDRINKLKFIVENDILGKETVKSYLSLFIRVHGSERKMELAVSKWKTDLKEFTAWNHG